MADFPTSAKVVIIGGGAVGASGLYHLAKKGWTDCVLLEKNELTAGSTWHAAGNVPTFSTSWAIMNMQRYSTELYARLGEEVDYPMNYHQTGSIRLAHTKERMQEFERACAMGRYQGIGMEMLTPEQAKERYPFLETHDLEGALYDPSDGDIDPAQLTQALAKGARDMGAKIIRFCPATGVTQKEDGTWIVHTDKGDIACEYVVNAAGYYAQRVGEWFKPYGGRTVPMMVMSHQYLLTEQIPEVEAWTKANAKKLPLIRDVDVSYYLRQEKSGYNLGPYEPNCRAHWVDANDPMPDDFSFQLWQDDLDRIEEIVPTKMLQHRAGRHRGLVGAQPHPPALRLQLGQSRLDAGIDLRALMRLAVFLGEDGPHALGPFGDIAARRGALQPFDEDPRAIADEAAGLFQSHLWQALGTRRGRGGIMDIGSGIDQRAIKVEDDSHRSGLIAPAPKARCTSSSSANTMPSPKSFTFSRVM
mgnify:CR=1 FL=1